MNRRQLLGTAASITVGGIAGCTVSQSANEEPTPSATEEPPDWYKCEKTRIQACGTDTPHDSSGGPYLSIDEWGFKPSETTVIGTATHSQDARVSCAAIQACFFDPDGTLVGIETKQRSLGADEAWDFEISYSGHNGDRIQSSHLDTDIQV